MNLKPKSIVGEVCLGLTVIYLTGIGGVLLAGFVSGMFK
jgi:hypothetical protein